MEAAVTAPPRAGIVRGTLTLHCYLIFGAFQFLINIQGNVLPFLKSELDISYRIVGLHPSGFAIGAILVGVLGERLIRHYGRRTMLIFGMLGMASAALLLCIAPTAPVSIAATVLLGLSAAFVPATVYPILADVHGAKRDIVINEINAVASGFGILAPLLTGVFVYLALGWRSAVIFGAALFVAIVASFWRLEVPDARRGTAASAERLSAAYWAYWVALALSISLEFCILLWAPAYLERVVGLAPATAAAAAAAFAVAMFLGRVAGSGLVRFFAVPLLLVAALGLVLVGFVLYWGVAAPVMAIAGLFIVGLGISLLFPLVFGLGMGAAGAQTDKASARTVIAAGLALLTMPALLGELADVFGLHAAHLIVPALVAAAFAAFAVGRRLEGKRLLA